VDPARVITRLFANVDSLDIIVSVRPKNVDRIDNSDCHSDSLLRQALSMLELEALTSLDAS
jgi:hypothetical protein